MRSVLLWVLVLVLVLMCGADWDALLRMPDFRLFFCGRLVGGIFEFPSGKTGWAILRDGHVIFISGDFV